jgi:hypothetical protein
VLILNTPNASTNCTSQPLATTLVTLGSTIIKHKWLNMFLPIIDATNKNTKVIMEAMDHINFTSLEIEECHVKLQECIIKF